MWARVDGLRSLELGAPGQSRRRLTDLVLHGRKRATAGLRTEYDREGEALEHVGEQLALVDDDGGHVATLEITSVEVVAFGEVPWSFAETEGEGDRDLEEWREGHRRFWSAAGTPVDDTTSVVCLTFEVVA